MKAWRVVIVGPAAIAAAIGAAGYFASRIFDQSMCGVNVVRRTASPDGRLEAVLFERNCGATTGFATHLSVVTTGSTITNDPGNLLVADDNDGRAALEVGNVIKVSVTWIGPDSLIVRYDPLAEVFHQAHRIQGVSVAYATLDEPGAQ